MGMSVTKQIRASRRADAEKRQAEYDKLTLAEKLAKLPAEPQAARQRAKLLAQAAEQKSKKNKDK